MTDAKNTRKQVQLEPDSSDPQEEENQPKVPQLPDPPTRTEPQIITHTDSRIGAELKTEVESSLN